MQTDATSHDAIRTRRAGASRGLSRRFLPFWKNDEDDDDNDPKGPPSAVALFFLPLLRSSVPAVA